MEGTTFWKYHGTGNDFVVLEALDGRPPWLTPETAARICDRHFGVGADGVLLVERGTRAPWFMRVINADGSEAEMCGNGIRCVARHLHDCLGVTGDEIAIETLAGVKPCRVFLDDQGQVRTVRVGLGRPTLDPDAIPMATTGRVVTVEALGRTFEGHGVGMGNPHLVIFQGMTVSEAEAFGAVLSEHPAFPRKTNVEFVEPLGPGHFRVVVRERGCGVTLACGTGAGATAVAAVGTGRARPGEPLQMDLPGGTLTLTVAEDLSEVFLQGPAVRVFQGRFDPAWMP
ncbi:MAG TPA: diaminopimelate epimerase [Myxococcota bacterium]|nr:diaminopimelate epimerase [Myxococcota bacterium]HQK52073.1 diaminopimelate epimerase [Myxococcota bacterium]